jgi:hypothetical protein
MGIRWYWMEGRFGGVTGWKGCREMGSLNNYLIHSSGMDGTVYRHMASRRIHHAVSKKPRVDPSLLSGLSGYSAPSMRYFGSCVRSPPSISSEC